MTITNVPVLGAIADCDGVAHDGPRPSASYVQRSAPSMIGERRCQAASRMRFSLRRCCCRKSYRHLLRLSVLALVIAMMLSCKGGKKHVAFGGGLPQSASDIHEKEVEMFPDWEYYLRATMPGPDCDALLAKVVRQENLGYITEHRWLDGKGDWGPAVPLGWWQPTWAGGHYHGRQGDVNTCAMCRDGIFYYWTGSH